ncbi:hypothetical protein SRABI27_01505 [Pedobacter sp. Bi27]|jgi:hypothetical protein|uniref:MafI family immunity protein n=1 Tax=Pedobacter sp. Bi27 TaxID=2822351 RepID=UPI001DEB61BB|nr:MafI family immunity protein [Pedobacter sp. Bi27]CAH0191046.1 hypothetical protein SRABI27_01505 [Pedobacter sp. Bi27]
MKKKLAALIEEVKILGLPQRDLDNANDFLINHEYGLCYDTVITQLYEYDIEIDNKIYSLISKIAKDLSLSENDYLFMKDLVRAETEISKKL